jgi:magnesium-transporting ATPase (P-type)
MKLSLLDSALWIGSFITEIALLFVLIVRGRWRQFPVFTALISFYVTQAILMFFIYRYSSPATYTQIYWITFAIDFMLQVALVFEIARIVLRPTGTWVRDARSSFLIGGLVGACIAAGLTMAVHPSALRSMDAWGIRAFLFTSLLFCELFLAMMFASQRLGLEAKNYVVGLSIGLTMWALVSAAVDVAHSYYGSMHLHDFRLLEHIRTFAYIAAVLYWTVIFWLPESERRPLSPEMQKYLVALHAKVQYDSSQVSSVQNFR